MMTRMQPLRVTFNKNGSASITMPARIGVLEMVVPAPTLATLHSGADGHNTVAQDFQDTVVLVIQSLNEGIAFVEEEILIRQPGPSKKIH